eukprot:gene513-319_t
MTFIPLSSIKSYVVDPRSYSSADTSATSALSCINFPSHLRKAFEYALGSTLIVDTLEEARKLAFEILPARGVEAKIVTLTGEVIGRNGNFSVDSSKQEGKSRFDIAGGNNFELARKRVEDIDCRLNEIAALEGCGGPDVASLTEDVRSLEVRIKTLTIRYNEVEEDIRQKDKMLMDSVNSDLPSSQTIAEQKKSLQNELKSIEENVHSLEESRLQEVRKQIGVTNVKAWVAQNKRENEKLLRQEQVFSEALSRLTAEENKIDAMLKEIDIDAIKTYQKKLQDELDELHESATKMIQDAKKAEQDVEKTDLAKRKILSQEKVFMQEFRQLRQQVEQAVRDRDEIIGDTTKHKVARKKNFENRISVLRRCYVEGITLPLKKGKWDKVSQQAAAHDSVADATTIADDAMEVDAPDLEEMFSKIEFDYKNLKASQKNAESAVVTAVRNDFAEEVRVIDQKLAVLKPNFVAEEKLSNVQNSLEETSDEIEGLRKAIEEVQKKVATIAKRRYDLFMDCFDFVGPKLDTIYKALTKKGDAEGGAYLDLEDREEPYMGGVRYTVMAPGNRIRDLSAMSGGERTMAACALLFALVSYRPPPFLVLDEVDAHLDAKNVDRLCNFFAKHAEFQTLVISLKDKFYASCDMLAGVYRHVLKDDEVLPASEKKGRGSTSKKKKNQVEDENPAITGSGVLTLDLTAYKKKMPKSPSPVKKKARGSIHDEMDDLLLSPVALGSLSKGLMSPFPTDRGDDFDDDCLSPDTLKLLRADPEACERQINKLNLATPARSGVSDSQSSFGNMTDNPRSSISSTNKKKGLRSTRKKPSLAPVSEEPSPESERTIRTRLVAGGGIKLTLLNSKEEGQCIYLKEGVAGPLSTQDIVEHYKKSFTNFFYANDPDGPYLQWEEPFANNTGTMVVMSYPEGNHIEVTIVDQEVNGWKCILNVIGSKWWDRKMEFFQNEIDQWVIKTTGESPPWKDVFGKRKSLTALLYADDDE